MTDPVPAAQVADIRDARRLFPATAGRAYFNTAAVGLASQRLAGTYHEFIDEWAAAGLDYGRGEQAAGEARSAVARLIGADAARHRADPFGVVGGRAGGRPVRPGWPGREHRDRAAGIQL